MNQSQIRALIRRAKLKVLNGGKLLKSDDKKGSTADAKKRANDKGCHDTEKER